MKREKISGIAGVLFLGFLVLLICAYMYAITIHLFSV